MIKILRLFAFVLSSMGWWEIIRKRSNINIYFIPGLTIALQVTVLFLCGLFNLLKEGTIALFLLGLLFLFLAVIDKKKDSGFIRSYCSPGFIYLGVILVLIGWFLKGKIFTHQDNFSHWAMVVKIMLRTNRMPNFMDSLIKYQEYPLGSSLYVYYFAKLAGRSESLQMLAQAFMILACILPLFIFVKNNKLCGLLVLFSVTNFFLTYNVAITDLLVDSLLPLVGACGIFFAVMYCRENASVRALAYASCYAIQMIQVKNSGLFFALPLCALIILSGDRKNMHARIGSAAAPLLSLILWHKHCDYVFKSSKVSRHALTLSNFKEELVQKSPEVIKAIAKDVVAYNIKWKDLWIAAAAFVILGAFITFFSKEDFKLFKKTLLVSVLTYLIYQIGMLGMYIFSMPLSEAVNLAGFGRYNKSIMMAIMYMYTALALKVISSVNLKQVIPFLLSYAVLPAVFCLFLFISSGKVRFFMNYTGAYSPKARMWLESAIKEYNIPEGESYCYVIPAQDYGYMRFLSKYLLLSNSNEAVIGNDLSKLDETKSKYIFLYDSDNEALKAWVLSNYPEQADERVIVRDEE